MSIQVNSRMSIWEYEEMGENVYHLPTTLCYLVPGLYCTYSFRLGLLSGKFLSQDP
jgi:hypothetical protein